MSHDNYSYPDIRLTDYIDESLGKLLDRDDAARIDWRMNGSFPSPVEESMIGMRCWREDLNATYRLVRVTPDPYWQLISNETGTPVTREDVEANFQAISDILTGLGKLLGTKDTFPYFAEEKDVQATNLTAFARQLLSKFDAPEVRALLGLGDASLLSTPIDGNYIKDGSISISKISTSQGGLLFSTGDLKPTYATTPDPGWILMDDGTIGSAISGASHADNNLKDLYYLWWNLPMTRVYTVTGATSEKASTAAIDWNGNKRLTMPPIVGRVIGVAGNVSGLTPRFIGDTVGEEQHTISATEMPSHSHRLRINGQSNGAGGGQTAQATNYLGSGTSNSKSRRCFEGNYTTYNTTIVEPAGGASGSSTKLNLMQPTAFVNWMVKL